MVTDLLLRRAVIPGPGGAAYLLQLSFRHQLVLGRFKLLLHRPEDLVQVEPCHFVEQVLNRFVREGRLGGFPSCGGISHAAHLTPPFPVPRRLRGSPPRLLAPFLAGSPRPIPPAPTPRPTGPTTAARVLAVRGARPAAGHPPRLPHVPPAAPASCPSPRCALHPRAAGATRDSRAGSAAAPRTPSAAILRPPRGAPGNGVSSPRLGGAGGRCEPAAWGADAPSPRVFRGGRGEKPSPSAFVSLGRC